MTWGGADSWRAGMSPKWLSVVNAKCKPALWMRAICMNRWVHPSIESSMWLFSDSLFDHLFGLAFFRQSRKNPGRREELSTKPDQKSVSKSVDHYRISKQKKWILLLWHVQWQTSPRSWKLLLHQLVTKIKRKHRRTRDRYASEKPGRWKAGTLSAVQRKWKIAYVVEKKL